MTDQAQEKIEELSNRVRRLVDEKARLYRANASLSALVASRNKTILLLEEEAKKAKARRKR